MDEKTGAYLFMVQEYSCAVIFIYLNFFLYYTGLGVVKIMKEDELVDDRKAFWLLTAFIICDMITHIEEFVDPILVFKTLDPTYECSDAVV